MPATGLLHSSEQGEPGLIAHARKEALRRLAGRWAPGRDPAPTDQPAKTPAVPEGEQHKRAARSSVEPLVLCYRKGAPIVDPNAHKLPLDISPQVFLAVDQVLQLPRRERQIGADE